MTQRFWLGICLILAAVGCSAAPTSSNSSSNGDSSSIDTSVVTQGTFSNQWVANTSGKVFSGSADLWGVGTQHVDLAFDSAGNLHDYFAWSSPPEWTPLHRIVMFYSGTQAIVAFYKSSSDSLSDQLYAFEIRGNKLYRTENIVGIEARGFTTISAWDGETYSGSSMVEIATLNTTGTPVYPTTPLTVPATNS